jgi:hypothetical protein
MSGKMTGKANLFSTIPTDNEHIINAEGFSINELNEEL